ncbi:preprotein translocase subunit SecE [bacterium]|nr:preprotein translocase subunit SecE [bacterium]
MKKLIQFIKESWVELKKVKWPSKAELWSLTVAVITASLILAIFTGIVDRIFSGLIHLILP